MTDAWGPPADPAPGASAAPGQPGIGYPGGYPAEPPTRGVMSRPGCVVALIGLFLLGFVGTLAVLFPRAPDAPAPPEPPLARLLQAPPGYERLPDSTSGGGRLTERSAAALLGRTDLPGFRDGVLRAWGRGAGQPPRAVVVLLVELDSRERAAELQRAYAAVLRTRGATPFATPTGLRAFGLREPPDTAGRHAQRVVFARGSRLYVVSVVAPAAERDTAEVVALATRQTAA